MKIQRSAFLSLGSNQGDKLFNLQTACNKLAEQVGAIKKISSVYKSEAWGFNGDGFLNICLEISTNLNPEKLLETVLSIEAEMGRIRKQSKEYTDRLIDIDVLLFDDEIIFYKNLKVPHERMLERRFVLAPLNEIASTLKHPIAKRSIKSCLEICQDKTEVEKTGDLIIKPISLVDKFNYIAIEGNIGAGKTSLANMIGDQFNAKLVLERFADNPFLPKFYKDKERYAFPLEMSFLADRYSQLSDDLAQFDLFKNFIVSDYYIFKSLIFAQVTLAKDEYALYRRMFDIMYNEITKPDLYVYLYQNTERLLSNIKKRGRDYEQNISPAYLEKIHKGYTNFIKTEQQLNTLVIDISDADFVNSKEDYKHIIKLLEKYN